LFAFFVAVGSAIPSMAELPEEAPEAPDRSLEPQAVAEREATEYAYSDISAAEEEDLLRSDFTAQLEELESDPARLLSRVQLDRVFSQSEALVSWEGEKALLESSIPIQVSDASGKIGKVDLGLEETDRGYAPANPIVSLSLPGTGEGRIYVGDSGLAISAEGANPGTTARTFGDGDLFIPEVHDDASLLLSPVAGGVDVSTLLLSRESPEQLRFAVTLPEEAILGASENGGAEVLGGDGGLIANVNPPHAVDAQGTDVPVSLSVERGSLVVDVPHRSMDLAYPVLVDPEVVENWSGWNDSSALDYWNWQWNTAGEKDYLGKKSCIVTCWGTGLYVRSKSEFTYGEGSYGRWWYVPQGSTTYIKQVVLGPMAFDPHGCTANQPHGYTGIWNDGGWWSVLATAYPSAWVVDEEASGLGEGDRTAFFAMGAASKTNIKCGRDYWLGGVTLYLEDPESPTIASVTGLPSGWVKGKTEFTVSVTATDPGLGVQEIKALGGPAGKWKWNQSSCAGTRKDPCASSRTGQITIDSDGLWEGKGTVAFQPSDPTGKAANSKSYEVWVDRLPPTVDLQGQLAKATEEEGEEEVPAGEGDQLSLPTYNLDVEASDATSGTDSIEVFLDESESPEPAEAPECVAGTCTLSYQLQLAGLSVGEHVLHVVATDQAENVQKRNVEFEFTPATGIKDEYVMQYIPLPDGLDHSEETESHGPEIAVNVINGNVVYHERDIQVEGRDANLELERSYNSQLPDEKDTRWGHGWSVAQMPEFESQASETPPTEATMLRTSGAITSAVAIPTSSSDPPTFDSTLHASIQKRSSGGYDVSYEDQEEENVFNSDGEIQETNYPSGASLNIDYKGPYEYVTPNFLSSFGTHGSGSGQLDAPGDLAFDSQGNIWLLDKGNNRVEKFNPKGEFLTKFGSFGSGNGQFHMPSAIAIDANDELWITDTENSRVEHFDSSGEYLGQFGSEGTANGQFGRPEGIAIDSEGNVWVADTYNSRIQQFTGAGEFIESFGSFGTGEGQFYNPTGIDFGAEDTLWIADWSNNRVTELNTSGEVLREIGSPGSGNGQFRHPDAVEADGKGRVWIGDEENNRVQAFSESSGAYITQFGTAGSAPGEFDFAFPMGIASNGNGTLRIADANNNRVQKWRIGEFDLGEEITGMTVEEADPWTDTDISVEFETVDGLVESVDVEGGPESDYSYESDLLTAVQDDEGETGYGYDSSGRLTSIELPNGTTAAIEYDGLSRATAVTVDPAGEEKAKTTTFKYFDEPRETRVSGGGYPEVIYSIGNDGSVFKWSYAAEPPKFASIGGTLWANRNSTTSLEPGDQTLTVTAESAHQIAEVQVLVNGEAAVEETTCEDDLETEKHECQQVPLEWITNTAAHPAGQLNLEVIATDFNEESIAERFFVTIPQQPETEPEAPVEPAFEEVKEFREEFGLDYESGRSEAEVNKLILELLEEWQLEYPLALWSAEEWGVPLREAEIKEMEFRERYVAQAATAIPAWAEANSPSTYAGYYVDQESGGLIHVGFTANQQALVDQLKSSGELIAPARVLGFPTSPARSLASLGTLQGTVAETTSSPGSPSGVFSIELDVEQNGVQVGTSEVESTTAFLTEKLGSQAGLSVVYQANAGSEFKGRFQTGHPFLAGEEIRSEKHRCTASLGAWSRVGTNKQSHKPIKHRYALTAGHCGTFGEWFYRSHFPKDEQPLKIGKPARRGFFEDPNRVDVDAVAIRLGDASLVPGWIYECCGGLVAMRPTGVAFPHVGEVVCQSGQSSNAVLCGSVVQEASLRRLKNEEGKLSGWEWTVTAAVGGEGGDSGAPVWLRYTGRAVGLVRGGDPTQGLFVIPFKRPPNVPEGQTAGILSDPNMSPPARPLHVQLGP